VAVAGGKRLMHCVQTGIGKRTPITHIIRVRIIADRTQDTFQGRKVCMPLLYFACTPPKSAIQHRALNGQRVSAKLQPRSIGGSKNHVLVPETIKLSVIMDYKYTGHSDLPNKYHGFVEVGLEGQHRYVVEVGSIESPVQLVEVSETRKSRKTWKVNNHIEL
jgi:hypothetical protein